ncbi:MAG: hypothetical protein IKW03_09540 [Clostridia bacterium]|nr:hypothetical protein [Clostridia bacterium]
MKYFIFNNQRDGSSYHEFYKGKWDEKTFWKSDSILLHDDYLFDNGFVDAIIDIIPTYDPFGVTEITADEWKKIGNLILTKDEKSQEIYFESNEWLEDVFKKYNCFTILGI